MRPIYRSDRDENRVIRRQQISINNHKLKQGTTAEIQVVTLGEMVGGDTEEHRWSDRANT